MTIRPARLSDFDHLETFVWQAIFPAFDIDGLSAAQRAENDALVENARTEVAEVLGRDHFGVFVAIDSRLRSLAGYVIVDARPRAYAEIRRLIVKRAFHGKGLGELLLDEATEFIGRDRAVSLAVRYYNQRAIAFFAKHGFEDTGETTGSHAIARTLMLREAFANHQSSAANRQRTTTDEDSFGFDFPSAGDEPVFEELPDYRLATDETPLFLTGSNALTTENEPAEEPEETNLTEDQLSVLEAFIAKARAKKDKTATRATTAKVPIVKEKKSGSAGEARTAFAPSKIAFEVDYGEGMTTVSPPELEERSSVSTAKPTLKPSFSFDFTPISEDDSDGEHVVVPAELTEATEATIVKESPRSDPSPAVLSPRPDSSQGFVLKEPTKVREQQTAKSGEKKDCPDCSTSLPAAARFCFVCGLPQSEPAKSGQPRSHAEDEPEEPLEELILEELPPLAEEPRTPFPESKAEAPAGRDQADSAGEVPNAPEKAENAAGSAASSRSNPVSVTDLRKAFQGHFQDRVLAYFGERKLKKYLTLMENDTAFLQVRDGSLSSLAKWLEGQPAADLARARRQNTFADLVEYFIVETAGSLSGNVLPQRLLRHQSADWKTADLFKLVMDYLDFPSESETVHTDFVAMPARALRNATKSFLHAAKDERVFFICDQSLISQAKNGFAVTDSGIYWKNVLQPAGAATFTTMREPRLEQGHLIIDGQFFDAGGRLNIKVAVLLDRLRRMR